MSCFFVNPAMRVNAVRAHAVAAKLDKGRGTQRLAHHLVRHRGVCLRPARGGSWARARYGEGVRGLEGFAAATACARALRCPYGARDGVVGDGAGVNSCCTYAMLNRNDGPLAFRRLGRGDYREPPKPVVADLSGVVQTDFLRMEECSADGASVLSTR